MKKFIQDFKEDYAYSVSVSSYIAPLINPGIYIVLLYRISNLFYRYKLGIIAKLIWWINRLLFTVDIHQGAKLSGGLVLVHGMGIVIGKEVISEGKLKIYQNVTLGGNSFKTQKYGDLLLKQPYLKNDITIYAGAAVVGPVIIDGNSIVGTNAVVTKNITANSLVVGINIIRNNR